MGRPPKEVEMVGIKVRIPKAIHGKVTLLLMDSLRGRVHYGDWTRLMTALLERWVNEQLAEHRRNERDTGTD